MRSTNHRRVMLLRLLPMLQLLFYIMVLPLFMAVMVALIAEWAD
jgi:hypothetical protein